LRESGNYDPNLSITGMLGGVSRSKVCAMIPEKDCGLSGGGWAELRNKHFISQKHVGFRIADFLENLFSTMF